VDSGNYSKLSLSLVWTCFLNIFQKHKNTTLTLLNFMCLLTVYWFRIYTPVISPTNTSTFVNFKIITFIYNFFLQTEVMYYYYYKKNKFNRYKSKFSSKFNLKFKFIPKYRRYKYIIFFLKKSFTYLNVTGLKKKLFLFLQSFILRDLFIFKLLSFTNAFIFNNHKKSLFIYN